MNRKGFEKPIEIFVALFIILAVALVLLKLFQSQISEKQKQLADVQQEQLNKEMMDKVQLSCRDKCTTASNNGCSLASLASLCMHGSKQVLASDQFIDLNNNKKRDYDDTFLAGIGVCEERIYCFHMLPSCCAREISPSSCTQILRDYWMTNGVVADDDEFDERFAALVPVGDEGGLCLSDPRAEDQLWDVLLS